jgi:hypothetical protein
MKDDAHVMDVGSRTTSRRHWWCGDGGGLCVWKGRGGGSFLCGCGLKPMPRAMASTPQPSLVRACLLSISLSTRLLEWVEGKPSNGPRARIPAGVEVEHGLRNGEGVMRGYVCGAPNHLSLVFDSHSIADLLPPNPENLGWRKCMCCV